MHLFLREHNNNYFLFLNMFVFVLTENVQNNDPKAQVHKKIMSL